MGCVDHGLQSRDGYGRRGRRLLHRLVYAEANGLDEAAMGGVVMHSCDNPRCINPEHLSLGTQADNVQDMIHKGRAVYVRGENHGSAKFSDAEVAAIRAEHIPRGNGNGYGNSKALIAKYGISKQMLSLILRGESR